MSRAEEITSEVRRLVLTCRAMEAQLQQSIPKKTHQEVVTKMQTTIDGLNAELERVRGELHKTVSLNDTIGSLGNQITSFNETITSLGRTVASQSQIIETQKATVEELTSKLSQTTVPVLVYDQTVLKVEELQEKIRGMVEKLDYTSLQNKFDEQSESLKSMVPREEYLNLQAQFVNFVPKESFNALQRTLSEYVPREQLVATERRLHEVETKLENSVPRSDYEELTGKIALLTSEASSLSVDVVPSVVGNNAAPDFRPVAGEVQASHPETAANVPVEQKVEKIVQSEPQNARTEITEIQDQLSEIKGVEASGETILESKPVDTTQGFVFANTTLCARTGLEFLQDLEQAPIESIENHMKGGDFERWFKDVLSDDQSAEYLRDIRESNYTGSELRAKIVAVISPRYK